MPVLAFSASAAAWAEAVSAVCLLEARQLLAEQFARAVGLRAGVLRAGLGCGQGRVGALPVGLKLFIGEGEALARIDQPGLRGADRGFRLTNPLLLVARVEFEEQIALLYSLADVEGELDDLAAGLALDLDIEVRDDLARGRDGLTHRPALDLGRGGRRRDRAALRAGAPVPEAAAGGEHDYQDDDPDFFHEDSP